MNRIFRTIGSLAAGVVAGLFWAGTVSAQVDIPGETDLSVPGSPTFNLVAKAGYISNPDGNTIYSWGYASGTGVMQYPGPTLIVNQGDLVTINFTSELPVPSSIVFPGQNGVTAVGGSGGVLTNESTGPTDTVTYSFTVIQPGTFQYHSGTRPDLQVEMGLVGALIVRPTGFDPVNNRTAYGHSDSRYDHEHLFLLTGMDLRVHEEAEANPAAAHSIDTSNYHPVYWFINGRSLPDTLMPDGAPWLPNQPYGAFVQAHPGDRVLVRFIGGTKNIHPLHTHGNNLLLIARDGKLLQSAPGLGADLSFSKNTITPPPGGTMDGIFQWTGKGMGWDIYGSPTALGPAFAHDCVDTLDNNTGAAGADGYDDTTWEWCADHDKPFPADSQLPGLQDLTFGGFWSGSPFLGHVGALPPGEGGLNPSGGYTFPWHSHHEVEVVNNDIFPGGMFTVFEVQPFGVSIP